MPWAVNTAVAIAAVAIALASCAGAPRPVATGTPTPAPASESVDLTGIEFRLEDAGGRPLAMAADGTLTGPQGFWGRVTADGTVSFPDGSVRGRLLADHRVVDARGEELASIAPDGTARVGDQALRFDDAGRLVGGSAEHPVRLVGSGTRVLRAAMLVLILSQLRHTKERSGP